MIRLIAVPFVLAALVAANMALARFENAHRDWFAVLELNEWHWPQLALALSVIIVVAWRR